MLGANMVVIYMTMVMKFIIIILILKHEKNLLNQRFIFVVGSVYYLLSKIYGSL